MAKKLNIAKERDWHGRFLKGHKKVGGSEGSHTQEAKDKIRNAMMGNTHCVGRVPTQEHRAKMRRKQSGADNPAWKGGVVDFDGYILLWKPDHPNANKKGYVFEHRVVMSEVLGRPLTKDEVVHHLDGNRKNNEPWNLAVETRKTHKVGYVGGYRAGFAAATILFLAASYRPKEKK